MPNTLSPMPPALVKYKGLKTEIAVLTKKIDAMNKGKSEKGLALMVVADEELSVGRADARLYPCEPPVCGGSKEKLAKQVSHS
ncbi:hypothetical protein Tco_1464370 [Tanacetum coccineum]